MPIVDESDSVRAFIDDPARRLERVGAVTHALRPTYQQMATVACALEHNPFVSALRTWYTAPDQTGYLILRWAGQTSGLRALSIVPSTDCPGPRVAFFQRNSNNQRRQRIRAWDDTYPLLMWPAAFPHGRRLAFADGAPVDDWKREGRSDDRNINFARATLFLYLQPERRDRSARGAGYARGARPTPSQWARRHLPGTLEAEQHLPGAFVLVRSANPYRLAFPAMRHGQPHASAPGSTPSLLYRRYSRFELLGKLGSEFLLDRHMTVRDHRRHMLRCDVVQRRVTGRMGSGAGAADADAPDAIDDADAPEEMRPSVPSFLPDTEPGSPRYQYAMCADAIFCTHALGTPIWFVTNTADPHWWECATRLPAFETERVPLDDRSNTSMRTALENDWPALTKPTWQNLYERPALHAEVFELKHQAFSAVLQSGTIFRNVGRPRFTHFEERRRTDGTTTRVPMYEFPLSIDRRLDGARGYHIDAMEYQNRNFTHGHSLVRPAKLPANHCTTPGVELPWVDEFACARIPDRSVLTQFKMIAPAREWRVLDGVCNRVADPQSGVRPAYAYVSTSPPTGVPYDDDDDAVHPDLVRDAGERFEDPNVLLMQLIALVAGHAAKLTNCKVRVEGLSRRGASLNLHTLEPSLNGRVGTVQSDFDHDSGVPCPSVVVLLDEVVDVAGRQTAPALRVDIPRVYLLVTDDSPSAWHFSMDHYRVVGDPLDLAVFGDDTDSPAAARANANVFRPRRLGRMIHRHPKHPRTAVPNVCATCNGCRYDYPFGRYD